MKSKIQRIGISFFSVWVVLLCLVLPVGASDVRQVYPGGMPFGVKFSCNGLVIVGFTEVDTVSGSSTPAYDAGLRVDDVILSVNGTTVKTAQDFLALVENTNDTVDITFERAGETHTVRFAPSYSESEQKYKTGMWIRDTTAGIGTVTFIEPDTGIFAGLGHGICDQSSGKLLPMSRGVVEDVEISGIAKGVCGRPGELKGCFTGEETGVLLKNTLCGVFGMYKDIPYDSIPQEMLPVGCKEDVHVGEAYIWCTLDDNVVRDYKIEITGVEMDDSRNFLIRVLDEELIEKTGGIVQGMSGSPIIQDGKLVGAVTHVLINDPCRGYGIFIENMLEAAEKSMN